MSIWNTLLRNILCVFVCNKTNCSQRYNIFIFESNNLIKIMNFFSILKTYDNIYTKRILSKVKRIFSMTSNVFHSFTSIFNRICNVFFLKMKASKKKEDISSVIYEERRDKVSKMIKKATSTLLELRDFCHFPCCVIQYKFLCKRLNNT